MKHHRDENCSFRDDPHGKKCGTFVDWLQGRRHETTKIHGIIGSSGKVWQEQRRFTLRNLRDFGFGKVSMEGLIQEEVEKCIEMLSQESGKVTKLSLKLNIAILNALWKLLTGEKV